RGIGDDLGAARVKSGNQLELTVELRQLLGGLARLQHAGQEHHLERARGFYGGALLVTLLGQSFGRAGIARVPAQRGFQEILARSESGIEMVSKEVNDGWGCEAGGRHKMLRYTSSNDTGPFQAT